MTITAAPDDLPDPADVSPLLALDPKFQAGYRAALPHGIEIGRAIERQAQADAWHAVADKVARSGPAHAALEARRWPDGRPARTCPTCGQPHRDGLRGAG